MNGNVEKGHQRRSLESYFVNRISYFVKAKLVFYEMRTTNNVSRIWPC